MQEENRYQGEDFEDIMSSSKPKDEFEDIVSSSSYVPKSKPVETLNFNSFADYNDDIIYYRKKKRGLAKVMSDVGFGLRKWWKNMKKGKKAALISVTAVLLVFISLFVWIFSIFDYNYNPISTNPEDLGIVGGQIDENVINVALFGIDTRGLDTFEGNADSIMILSLNIKTKKIKIISIVRDTLVRIEDSNGKVTYNKINSSYQKGGPQLAVKTLNQNFGLDIMKYATVNFYGMAEIIDAVGGIEATVTQDELTAYPGYDINTCIKEICDHKGVKSSSHLIKKKGTQHLNGIQAVAYARIRMGKNIWGTNNDFGRSDRQRYVMEQLFNKAKQMKASEFLPFAEALCPCVQTNYKPTEIASLASNILLDSPKFEQYRLPMVENGKSFLMTSPKGSFGSVVYYDLEYAKKAVHAIIYDDITMDEFIEKNPIEKNDWYGEIVGKPSSSTTQKPSTSTPSTSEPDDNSQDDGETPEDNETPPGQDTETDGDTSSDSDSDEDLDSGGDTDAGTPPDDDDESGSDEPSQGGP
ncbi:MAG: LCP family protein [Clostridia bacterium]|nr:LCP family protein [Clostridia bacterium]